MSSEGYAAFLERMGHDVRLVGGRYWFDSSARVYQTFPFTDEVIPESVDIGAVLGSKGLALRYTCPLSEGRSSYALVVEDGAYGLGTLMSKARNQTRRGLEQCRVEQVSFTDLERYGFKLNRDTMLRQGRKLDADFDGYWKQYYAAADMAEGAEAWCAFVDDAAAAYLIAFETGGTCNILIVRSAREQLKAYPNNALLFTYISAALSRTGVNQVSIGLEPIQRDMEALDHFKLGLGFKKRPCGQRVEVAPWLKPWLRGPVLAAARGTTRLMRRNEKIDKLHGLLDWAGAQGAPGSPARALKKRGDEC